MSNTNIIEAVEQLNYALEKVNDIDEDDFCDLSEKILDNRIITLEGYLRYLESEGIPKIKKILKYLEEENND